MDRTYNPDEDYSPNYHYMRDSVDYEVNREILKEMEEVVPMTLSERHKLRIWVRNGHDVESNPWGYLDSDGCPMNYIQAYRLEFGYSSGPWDTWKGPPSQPYWSVDKNSYIWPTDDFN